MPRTGGLVAGFFVGADLRNYLQNPRETIMRGLFVTLVATGSIAFATLTEAAMTSIALSFSDGSRGKCYLQNKHGAWATEVPATASVEESRDLLQFDCETLDGRKALGAFPSRLTNYVIAIAEPSAQASRFVSLGRGADEIVEVKVDVDSIFTSDTEKGRFVTAYVQFVMANHSTKGPGDDASRWVTMTVRSLQFHCDKKRIRTFLLIYFFDDGTSYSEPLKEFPSPWGYVTPNATERPLMAFVCSWRGATP